MTLAVKEFTIVQPVFSIGEIGAGEKGQAEGSNVCFSASSLVGRQGGSDFDANPLRNPYHPCREIPARLSTSFTSR